MASWVLICKRCGEIIHYREIGDSLIEYFIPEKPEMPREGMVCACPICNANSIYKQSDLTFHS
jgi:hypothetical protein